MPEVVCERCGACFSIKKYLIQHLHRKKSCDCVYSKSSREEILQELTKKEGIECEYCSRVYKNKNSLAAHKCKKKGQSPVVQNIKEEDKISELQKQVNTLQESINILINKQVSNTTIQNITNIDNSTTNNNLNVTLNCLMDCSGKPIDYLLKSEDLVEKVLGWIKSKNGLLEYIDEKFYNPKHPENRIIQKGPNSETIKLHISGKWKQLNNIKASDLILTNVGNDFMYFVETIKDDNFNANKNALKKFELEVMRPLEWGYDVNENSQDSNNLITKTIVKNQDGEYIYLEDEIAVDKKLEMTKKVVDHIHAK
jgi:hypothetical protein